MSNQAVSTSETANPNFREPAAMSVEAFLRWAGISRFLFYQEVKRGRIHPRKCGGRTVIPVQEAERWLQDLPFLVTSPQPAEG